MMARAMVRVPLYLFTCSGFDRGKTMSILAALLIWKYSYVIVKKYNVYCVS